MDIILKRLHREDSSLNQQFSSTLGTTTAAGLDLLEQLQTSDISRLMMMPLKQESTSGPSTSRSIIMSELTKENLRLSVCEDVTEIDEKLPENNRREKLAACSNLTEDGGFGLATCGLSSASKGLVASFGDGVESGTELDCKLNDKDTEFTSSCEMNGPSSTGLDTAACVWPVLGASGQTVFLPEIPDGNEGTCTNYRARPRHGRVPGIRFMWR